MKEESCLILFFLTLLKVQCFSLYSLLLAINVTTVDYFSLDIEGAEVEVLQTIPFDKIKFNIISVEYEEVNTTVEREKIEKIKSIILGTGEYEFLGYLPHSNHYEPYYVTELPFLKQGQDVVFRRKI